MFINAILELESFEYLQISDLKLSIDAKERDDVLQSVKAIELRTAYIGKEKGKDERNRNKAGKNAYKDLNSSVFHLNTKVCLKRHTELSPSICSRAICRMRTRNFDLRKNSERAISVEDR